MASLTEVYCLSNTIFCILYFSGFFYALVAQSDRALASGAKGFRFESCQARFSYKFLFMLHWQSIVQDYIIKYSNQIIKTTKPLKTHFGISYFTYHKIDASGKYTVLVDRPDWAEHYVDEKIFLYDPYLRHPSVYRSGICLVDSFGSQEYRLKVIEEGKRILGMDMGVTLIQKTKEDVEFFGFTADQKTSSLQSLYLNDPQVFKSFARHFKKELTPILRVMEEEAPSLLDLKGEDFFCKDHIYPETPLEKREGFYKDLGAAKDIEKAASLSSRERECLRLLIQGQSAKETAKTLELSPRTIEFYFENIKKKCSFWNKQELFQFAKNIENLGFL